MRQFAHIGLFLLLSVASILPSLIVSFEISEQCPSQAELDPNCVCYPSVRYLTCTDVKTPFNFTKNYRLKSLLIINSFPLLNERFNPRRLSHSLYVDTLVIRQNDDSPPRLPSVDNMEDLFGLTAKSVQILANKDNDRSLDVSDLSSKLLSLTISNVRSLIGFDFDKFSSLKQIALRNVHFQKPIHNVFLINSSLTHIEITNTEALTGGFVLQPLDCRNQKIHIDLRYNRELTYFDFSLLFDRKNVQNCTYHIDLSECQAMRPELLVNQASQLSAQESGTFYLVLRDVPNLKCDCAVLEMYRKHSKFVHAVQCQIEGKLVFLDQLEKSDLGCRSTNATEIYVKLMKFLKQGTFQDSIS